LALSMLSDINVISGLFPVPVIVKSSTPFEMAPSGEIRSWQIRDPKSAEISFWVLVIRGNPLQATER